MPPRRTRNAAPATAALAGLSIAISGSVPGHTQAGIESKFIGPLGASQVKSVSASTTRLVATGTDSRQPPVNVRAAQASGIPIVTFEWLEDCLDREKRMNEQAYTLATQAQQHPAANSTSGTEKPNGPKASAETQRTRKRQAVQNGDEDSQAPQPKKGKPKEDEFKEETKEREPKVAEGQVAKSSDVKIALDEPAQYMFVGYNVYIDEDNIIYDASLNQSSATNNNNKFYRIQVSSHCIFYSHATESSTFRVIWNILTCDH